MVTTMAHELHDTGKATALFWDLRSGWSGRGRAARERRPPVNMPRIDECGMCLLNLSQ